MWNAFRNKVGRIEHCRCSRRQIGPFEVQAMTELVTQDRAPKPKRDKVRMVADEVVTANSLATHRT